MRNNLSLLTLPGLCSLLFFFGMFIFSALAGSEICSLAEPLINHTSTIPISFTDPPNRSFIKVEF
jgi:hypothetical protein